jgi:hypothetical protein
MSNSADNILNILIRFGLSNEQAAAAAKDIIQETGKATQKLGEDHQEAAKKVKLFHEEAGEMRKVIGEVTQMSPLLGEALRIAMNPIGGTVAAAVGLFVLMKEHLAEVNKELDEQAERAADPTFIEGIRARLDVLREASKAAAEYSTHINTLLTGEQGITSELASQLSLQAAITAARQEQTKAELTLEQAKIKAAQARGEISPEVAAARLASANAKAIADEARAKSNAQYGDVSTKTTALETAENQMAGMKANADALTKAYNDEAARRARNAKDFGGDDFAKQTTEAQAQKEKADKEFEKVKFNNLGIRGQDGSSAAYDWDTAALHVAQAEAKLNSLRQGRAQFKRDQDTEGQFNDLGSQATEARAKAEANATAIGTLTGELKRLTDTILATRGAESATVSARIAASNTEYAGDLAGQNAKAVAKENSALTRGNPAEIQKAIDEAHAHGRGLVAAANAARETNKAVYEATIAALDQFRREQAEFVRKLRQAPLNNH